MLFALLHELARFRQDTGALGNQHKLGDRLHLPRECFGFVS
jgi:hypothetical protein